MIARDRCETFDPNTELVWDDETETATFREGWEDRFLDWWLAPEDQTYEETDTELLPHLLPAERRGDITG